MVEAITTADYPTPARRPLNSRLSTERIERDFGIVPRPWEDALADVVDTLLRAAAEPAARLSTGADQSPTGDFAVIQGWRRRRLVLRGFGRGAAR